MLANSQDPDQTPRSAASDLGMHCLPRSPKRDARLIWVNSLILRSFCMVSAKFMEFDRDADGNIGKSI